MKNLDVIIALAILICGVYVVYLQSPFSVELANQDTEIDEIEYRSQLVYVDGLMSSISWWSFSCTSVKLKRYMGSIG